MGNVKVLDIFHQSADDGIPPHWCVQYVTVGGNGFAEYEYFGTYDEAEAWANENSQVKHD